MITVCLATHNGEKYLHEQIVSLHNQSFQDFQIFAIDDCSSDSTVEILAAYNIHTIKAKKNIGVKASFSRILAYALKNTKSNFFMFCDQDDIWEKDKIKKEYHKIISLNKQYPQTPLLVYTDLTVIDSDKNLLHKSFLQYQNLHSNHHALHQLLMQNSITGCTMIINRKLATLALPIPEEAIMHDWWIGLVASQFGEISYLDETTLQYRQHESNTIGTTGFGIGYLKEKSSGKNILSIYTKQAKLFLQRYKKSLNQQNILLLTEFSEVDKKSFLHKRLILLKHKILKHGFIRNVGLMIKI